MPETTKTRPQRPHGLLLLRRVAAILLLLVLALPVPGVRPAQPTAVPCLPDLAPGANAAPQAAERPCWALIGNDSAHLAEEYAAGIRFRIFSLDWNAYAPAETKIDAGYVAAKRAELAAVQAAGFGVILSLGFHDPPRWIHQRYANSYYVNQYGDRYVDAADGSDANLVFNSDLRRAASVYIDSVFATFGTAFAAVRLGGGRYGELTYPPAEYGGRTNCYWAFDANALASMPVRNWRPAHAALAGEAQRFVNWYLDRLVDFQNWQIDAVRAAGYDGPLMMLYPSWGIRRGDLNDAIRGDLAGTTPAEQNGEIQRGYDFVRQIGAIHDPEVIVTTTWLDADPSGDNQVDPRYWSPVKYLAHLAQTHPLHLSVYGENTGQGSVQQLALSADQTVHYGLIGMAWLNERELFSHHYATLDDFRRVIAAYSPHP